MFKIKQQRRKEAVGLLGTCDDLVIIQSFSLFRAGGPVIDNSAWSLGWVGEAWAWHDPPWPLYHNKQGKIK